MNADIGGLALLADLRVPLARWGLAYLAVGALLGPLRTTRLGAAGPAFAWLALVAVADVGVAPRWLTGALALAAVLLAELPIRLLREAARKAGLTGLAVVLLLAGIPRGSVDPVGSPSDAPHVVLVVVDTLRADHVGAYGGPPTPAIDRLAAEGLRFEGARANASWTLPSHASLFTGQLPSEHGAHAASPVLGPGPTTLAEAFAARGYRTVGLSANAWVSAGTGLDRGFQDFRFVGADAISSQLLLPLVFTAPDDLGARAITDAAKAAIADAAASDEPLFLFANYLEAHEPLGTIPGETSTEGRAWVRELPRFWCACATDAPPLTCRGGLYRAPPERIARTVDLYDAGVAYVDGRIGELRGALDAAGVLDDTVFVVTSDHGEHLGEDDRLGHMVWLTEPLLQVPLIVRYPARFRAGAVRSEPIDLASLHPWLLAVAAGAPEPAPPSRLTAESHPHPEALRDRWSALFGCDFGPAGVGRRVVHEGGRSQATTGPEVELDGPQELSPATRAALEALGYLQ